jgi:hypothetical protein
VQLRATFYLRNYDVVPAVHVVTERLGPRVHAHFVGARHEVVDEVATQVQFQFGKIPPTGEL